MCGRTPKHRQAGPTENPGQGQAPGLPVARSPPRPPSSTSAPPPPPPPKERPVEGPWSLLAPPPLRGHPCPGPSPAGPSVVAGGGGLQRKPGPGPAFLAEWPRHRWDGPSGRSVSLEGRPVYLPRKQLQQKCAWGGGRFARCHAPPKVGSPALGQTGAVWGLKVQVTVFRAHGPGGQTAARSCTDLQAQESRPAAPSLGRPRSPSCQGSRARRWPPGTPERDPSPSPARPRPPRQPLHRRLGSERVPRPPGPRSLEEGTL